MSVEPWVVGLKTMNDMTGILEVVAEEKDVVICARW